MSEIKPSKLSYCSGTAEKPLIYETIGQCFDRIARTYPDKEALVVVHQKIRWGYAEYRKQVDRLATGLLRLGIQPGDRVGIWSPNCSEWCLTQLATAKIGVILVCINPAYRLHELEYALNKSGCRVLITAENFKSSDYLGMIRDLAPELAQSEPGMLNSSRLPKLGMVVSLGQRSEPGFLRFCDICQMGTEADYQRLAELSTILQPDDVINIQFTSGTTGNPKGATLSHFNILNNAYQVAHGMNFSYQDRLCIPIPLYHCFGMVLGNLVCLTSGATAVFPGDAFDARTTVRVIEQECCTALHGVPTMFIAQLELPDLAQYKLSSLRTGIMSGAPCPVEIMKQVIKDMNMSEVMIVYGQTETSPVNHLTALDDSLEKRVSTVGHVAPHLETKVIDENGRTVAIGEKGEICCRGYAVMRGYWEDQEKTQETIDSAGWLHSGDLAVMDEQGYVQIVGRKKDMIIRGGENIYPREIEEFLYSHDLVQEVQVFGIPDARLGEEVCAWIQIKGGAVLTESDIKKFCDGQIAHFKIPKHIRFVESYPMTVTGKIQKFKMRDLMLQDVGAD